MSLASRLGTIAGHSKFIAKHYYPMITRSSVYDLVFSNMGYEEDPPMAVPLAASDEPNRFSSSSITAPRRRRISRARRC